MLKPYNILLYNNTVRIINYKQCVGTSSTSLFANLKHVNSWLNTIMNWREILVSAILSLLMCYQCGSGIVLTLQTETIFISTLATLYSLHENNNKL